MIPAVIQQLAKKIPQVRRMHCFCLGAAKTGTTSLAAMFDKNYRSVHEPEMVTLTAAVAKILGNGPATDNAAENHWAQTHSATFDVVDWLQARDRRLNLEVEASHPLGYMAPWLPQAFPEARFVITIRDPLAWLKSRLNFHYYKSPPEWQAYRNLIWSRWHKRYWQEESLLEELGLYSIDAYLAQYSEQYQLLFRYLPVDRRLLVNTRELDNSIEKLGDFLMINPDTITRQHANAFTHEESIIDRLSPEFVAWRIEMNCQWLMKAAV